MNVMIKIPEYSGWRLSVKKDQLWNSLSSALIVFMLLQLLPLWNLMERYFIIGIA